MSCLCPSSPVLCLLGQQSLFEPSAGRDEPAPYSLSFSSTGLLTKPEFLEMVETISCTVRDRLVRPEISQSADPEHLSLDRIGSAIERVMIRAWSSKRKSHGG